MASPLPLDPSLDWLNVVTRLLATFVLAWPARHEEEEEALLASRSKELVSVPTFPAPPPPPLK